MQKQLESTDPVNFYPIKTTPEELKTLAAKIEAKMKTAEAGQIIFTRITSNITLVTEVPYNDRTKQ